jgi:hypothetical protein
MMGHRTPGCLTGAEWDVLYNIGYCYLKKPGVRSGIKRQMRRRERRTKRRDVESRLTER